MALRLTRFLAFAWLLATASAQTFPLSFRPLDAEYSSALDRIVMVSGNPNQLHIYDPASGIDTTVNLDKAPTSVSISPNGLYAAVGHDLLVSYVNLSSAAVERTYVTTRTAVDVVLGPAYAYVIPPTSSSYNLSIELASGAVTESQYYNHNATSGRLHPSGTELYTSGSYLVRYDISTGPITGSRYLSSFSGCPQFWFSANGRRIYNNCGTVLQPPASASADLLYVSSIGDVNSSGQSTGVIWVSEATTPRQLAVIPRASTSPLVKDNEVRILDTDYLVQTGRFQIPDIAAGPQFFQAHGKWVFFNSSATALRVIAQADATSGLLQDFVVHTIELANPPSCAPSLSSNSATAIAEGGLASVTVTAPATCTYRATSNASWIQPVSGGYGSGSGTLTYLVRPNTDPAQRTGTFSVGGQTFTITQSGAPTTAQPFYRLAYKVVDAAYRKTGDRLVFVTTDPNELHQFDPITRTDMAIALPQAPLSLSLRPDGQYAAVGHDGWMSYVNLQSGVLERIYEINSRASRIVLAGNGYVYTPSRALLLSSGTGALISLDSALMRLHPLGNYIYSRYYKWNITQGLPTSTSFSGYGGCNNLWFSETGNRAFSSCGGVYRSSESPSEDGQFNGMLSGLSSAGVTWVAQSAARQSIAAIPAGTTSPNDTELRIYGDSFLGPSGALTLPRFNIAGTDFAGRGSYVFWDSTGGKLIVVMRADNTANLLSNFGVNLISPGGCSVTLGSNSGTLPSSGGFGSVTVTAATGCVWESRSNDSWLTVDTGRIGIGPVTLSFSAATNTSLNPRTGTLTIGGLTFTVTQGGLNGTSAITPALAAFGRSGGVGSAAVTVTPSSLQWTAVSNAGWITVTGGATGSGNGTVQYSVSANGGSPRSGTVTIAGRTLTVSQAGTATNAAAYSGIFRSGFFWLQDVDGNRGFNAPPDRAFAFGGLAGDVPISGDWNGDGRSEVGVYRGVNGTFLLDLDGDREFTATDRVVNLGVGVQAGDVPVVGDWNGDGLSKVGLFRAGFLWILDTNGDGVFTQNADQGLPFGGVAGDIPIAGDWDGDGRTNLGLFRGGFYWILDQNGNGSIDNVNQANGDKAFAFGGLAGDVPLVGDWNGDGRSKVGVFRAGFFWVLDGNGNTTFDGTGPGQDLAYAFGGIAGDKPVIGKW